MSIFIGCAGWSIPAPHAARFAADGSHLGRYATLFNSVEINSSFYRPHQKKTYRRWAETVPARFRFSVKVPKEASHERRLVDVEDVLARFLDEVQELGDKLGPLLLQLPPSLSWSATEAIACFESLRRRVRTPIVCEPRHTSWFTSEVDRELRQLEIGRVAADPAIVPAAALPGGCTAVTYYRLHGSPRMYYSAYSDDKLAELSRDMSKAIAQGPTTWCIFDNTAAGAAVPNALRLGELAGLTF